MEQRPTKKEIIDQMIEWATLGRFKGDKRDGQAPPIKVQNFTNEMIIRYAAKALRARLSRLPFAELWTEAIEAADYVRAQQEQILKGNELVDRLEREAAERVDRQQQSDRAKRSRRQPAILAAARHYRGRGMNAGEAWDAINNAPYATGDGNTVKIEGPKLRLEQRMRVISRDGRQPKRPIRFAHWRQFYWIAAGKPG